MQVVVYLQHGGQTKATGGPPCARSGLFMLS